MTKSPREGAWQSHIDQKRQLGEDSVLKANKLASKGSLANYLWAIARGWLRDHARRLPPPLPIEDLENERSPDSGPERSAALGELMDRARKELVAEDVALFQWVYLAGVSRAVAAERLEIALEAVHKRVQRLEAKIRAIVSEEDPAVLDPPRNLGSARRARERLAARLGSGATVPA